jgi:hypothetical protein
MMWSGSIDESKRLLMKSGDEVWEFVDYGVF